MDSDEFEYIGHDEGENNGDENDVSLIRIRQPKTCNR